jgi:hypothetical protein
MQWKLHTYELPGRFIKCLMLYRKLPNNRIEYLQPDGLIRTIDEGTDMEGCTTLELLPEQMQAFANGLSDMGINPQKEYIEGKLEATSAHLEDMRKIVFEPTVTEDRLCNGSKPALD